MDLWWRKRPLYQLSHHHCPILPFLLRPILSNQTVERVFVIGRHLFHWHFIKNGHNWDPKAEGIWIQTHDLHFKLIWRIRWAPQPTVPSRSSFVSIVLQIFWGIFCFAETEKKAVGKSFNFRLKSLNGDIVNDGFDASGGNQCRVERTLKGPRPILWKLLWRLSLGNSLIHSGNV